MHRLELSGVDLTVVIVSLQQRVKVLEDLRVAKPELSYIFQESIDRCTVILQRIESQTGMK